MSAWNCNFTLFLRKGDGGGVLEHPVFLSNISKYFPDASK